jgi:3-hydroxymyristoyl/3-hydroxydecanoyl-(acyl carrier protein) dehydratase
MPTTYDHIALQALIPHRGLNIIPDVVEISDDRKSAISRTRIPDGDARGRRAFMRGDGRWWEPFIAELLALTGVPLLAQELQPLGQVAVFSMVSRITFAPPPAGASEIVGYSWITRQRSGFTTFGTKAEVDGKIILEAEVMSGSAALGEIAAFPARPFHGTLPSEPIPAGILGYKPSHLRFVDGIMHAELSARTVVCRYTYPANHLFVPGHFPDAPLMMGMTQWTAVADAGCVAAALLGLSGTVTVNGKVTRQDGSEVLDVRDLVLEDVGGGRAPRIASTKRLAFREPVRPTDGLLISVTV